MLYLNHGGTSWPKPEAVQRAVRAALLESPRDWPASFDRQHRAVAGALGIGDPTRLLLTPGCTSALAAAIADLPWCRGERVITSAWEHDALLRPVLALGARGVEHEIVGPGAEGPLDLDRLEERLLRGGGKVRLVAVTAAANVTGALLPMREIVALAHAHGAAVLVDGAQVVGWLDLDLEALGADLFTFAGHKGPQAPWGVGGLYVSPDLEMCPPRLAEGTPASMPGYCDTGSVDRLALAGLAAGFEWLAEAGQVDRLARGRRMMETLATALGERGDVTLYGPGSSEDRVPTLAMNLEGYPARALGQELARGGVFASGGRQCAPLAHRSLGTLESGVLRLSVGPTTRAESLEEVLDVLDRAARSRSR